jgi:hypothetical protein
MFFQNMTMFGQDLPIKTLRLKDPPQHGISDGTHPNAGTQFHQKVQN